MNKMPTISSLTFRRTVTFGIVVYFMALVAGFVFVTQVFGAFSAIKLSIIPILPIIVAVRMHRRWPSVRRREIAFFFALVLIVTGSSVGVVWNWFYTGMDRLHAEDLEYAAIKHIISEDKSYKNVSLHASPRHIFWMRGTVASDADLNRLRKLANQSHFIQWNEELRVIGSN